MSVPAASRSPLRSPLPTSAPLALASPPTTTSATSAPSAGRGLLLGSVAGVAWNLYGVVQFLQTLQSTPESLRRMGMTAAQAAVYTSYPAWMTGAFAVGVWGGLAGSALLLARRAWAVPVLALSLLGYLALYVGDITEGVFAALGAPQVAILTTVVAVATALLVWSRRLARRGALR